MIRPALVAMAELVVAGDSPEPELAREFARELLRMKPIYDLACELQDSDQCEDHVLCDDCETGNVEDRLFQELSRVRTDAEERGEKPAKIGTVRNPRPEPSTEQHVTNAYDECVSWCVACGENRARGFNPDGTVKA